MSYQFHAAVDNAASSVTVARSIGGTHLTVADASSFGTAYPIWLSIARGQDAPQQIQITVLEATSRSGNVFAISGPAPGKADAACLVGDVVEVRPSAADKSELVAAISSTPAVGAPVVGGTAQAVLYVDAGGDLGQDSTLYYNSTNHTLVTQAFKVSASPSAGFVLTSDVNGVGTWQAAKVAVGGSLTGGSAGRVLYDAGGTVGESAGLTTDGNRLTIQSTNTDVNFDNALVIHNTSGVVGKYSSLVFESNGNSSAYIRAIRDNAGTGYDTELIFGTATTAALGTPAERLRITPGGGVGINTGSTIGAQLHVVSPAATTVGEIVQLAASQSADAVQVKDSSGNVLAHFDAAGNLGLGTTYASTTGNNKLWVEGNIVISSVSGGSFGIGVNPPRTGSIYALTLIDSAYLNAQYSLTAGGGVSNRTAYDSGYYPTALYVQSNAASGAPTAVIQLAASQTADALQVKDSSGNVLASLNASGSTAAIRTDVALSSGNHGEWLFGYLGGSPLGGMRFTLDSTGSGATSLAFSTWNGSTRQERLAIHEVWGGVTVNTATAGAQFHITTNGANIPGAIIDLTAGQFTPALQVRDSNHNVLASIDATGTISSPQGTQCEHFGALSTAAGSIYSTAIGYGAAAGDATHNNATAVGHLAYALEQGSAIGKGATSTGSISTAIGFNSLANNFFATAIGAGASATASAGLAIGCTATAGGPDSSFCLGYGATSNYVGAMALGRDSVTTQANQAVLGANAGSSYAINCLTIPGMTPLAPSGVPNNSLFLDSTNSNKLSWKDAAGTTSSLI